MLAAVSAFVALGLLPGGAAAREAGDAWSVEFEQSSWIPVMPSDVVGLAVAPARAAAWNTGGASPDGAGSGAPLVAYDLDAGAWWNDSVGAVVRTRVVDDALAAGPQAMLGDACIAWRVASAQNGAVDVLVGARVAAASDADNGFDVGSLESESAAIAGARVRSEIDRGWSLAARADVAPRVSGAGVAWSASAGVEVSLDGGWNLGVDAGWRTLDAALVEALGGVPSDSSDGEGAVWVGFSKSF